MKSKDAAKGYYHSLCGLNRMSNYTVMDTRSTSVEYRSNELNKHHAIRIQERSEVYAFLTSVTDGDEPLFSQEKWSRCPHETEVYTPKSTFGLCGEDKDLLPLSGIKHYFLYHPPRHYTNGARGDQKT
jgi:hypothetical protein